MLSRRTYIIGLSVVIFGAVIVALLVVLQSISTRISLNLPLERSAAQIAYLRFYNRGPRDADVYLLDLESGKVIQLTTNYRVKRAEWSPDGESLILNIGEKQRLELLSNGQTQVLPDSEGYTPIFSPDKTHFAYDNCPYDTGNPYEWSKSVELFVVETDNTANPRIIKNACFPAWSPSGNQIAFTSQQSDDADPEIYIQNLDGSKLHRLTTNRGADVFPKWSPTANHIVFQTVSEDDPNTIYRVDVNGQHRVRIDDSYSISPPRVWSPDGQTLLYTDSLQLLCVLKGDATKSDCLLDGGIFDVIWSPDGTQAAYSTQRAYSPDGFICLTNPLVEIIVEKRCFPGNDDAVSLAWRPNP
jgi:Tol biopolymer transport system component